MADPKSRRRWLRFSLRSLLLVMLLVCVTLGWRVEQARKQRKAVEWVLQSGGSVQYGYELDEDGAAIAHAEPPGPEWLRNTLGVDFFADVILVNLRSQQVSDVSPLAGLTSLERLQLRDTQVSDVSPLAGLRSLRSLSLQDTRVRDVSGLTSLEALILQGTQVNDVSLLSGLKSLTVLSLRDTPVSDVSPLAG